MYTQKNLLCIHKRSLVHAQHSCACSGPGTPGARDPEKARSRAWDRPSAFFGSLDPGVPCPEHAQECCACTRDLLCIHKRFFCVYTIKVFSFTELHAELLAELHAELFAELHAELHAKLLAELHAELRAYTYSQNDTPNYTQNYSQNYTHNHTKN